MEIYVAGSVGFVPVENAIIDLLVDVGIAPIARFPVGLIAELEELRTRPWPAEENGR
jgi:hypothetical protein